MSYIYEKIYKKFKAGKNPIIRKHRYINFKFIDAEGGDVEILIHIKKNLGKKLVILHIFNAT